MFNSMTDMSYDEHQILFSTDALQKTIIGATRSWLHEHIGENWYYSSAASRIFFKYEEDKVKFILRWM